MSTRRHYTQQERASLLSQFDHRKTTAVAFCQKHDLCYQTFLRWRKNARDLTTQSETDFIEIDVPTFPPASPAVPQVELSFPGGLTLRIHSQVPIQP